MWLITNSTCARWQKWSPGLSREQTSMWIRRSFHPMAGGSGSTQPQKTRLRKLRLLEARLSRFAIARFHTEQPGLLKVRSSLAQDRRGFCAVLKNGVKRRQTFLLRAEEL